VDAALTAAFLVLGLALGSFVNVVAARVPLRRSIVSPRSACMSCGAEIAWYDNIPLLSYALLRGRCRACGTHISLRYPLVELATALLVAGSVWKFGVSGEAAAASLFCAALVAVSVTDLEHGIVPNRIVLPAAGAVLAAQTLLEPSVEWAVAAFGAAALLFAVTVAYPAGMGMGDVKVALLLGAMLGWYVPVALLVAVLAALVPSVVLLVREGPAARKRAIPFAPFLAIGGIVALFAAEALVDAYTALW
jgi:leader peptidase (prepilin peptidase) / N-methyltransferase